MILRTLTPFLSLIIAILLYFFLIQPQYVDVVMLKGNVEEYDNATAQYQEFTRKLDNKLAKKMDRLVLDNERLDIFIPNSIDSIQLLVDLEAMAGQQKMLFGNVSIDEGDVDFSNTNSENEQVSAELATSDISFEVVGSYEQFKNFIHDLERSLTVFEIVNIKFVSVENSMFGQYAVTVRTFALPKS